MMVPSTSGPDIVLWGLRFEPSAKNWLFWTNGTVGMVYGEAKVFCPIAAEVRTEGRLR